MMLDLCARLVWDNVYKSNTWSTQGYLTTTYQRLQQMFLNKSMRDSPNYKKNGFIADNFVLISGIIQGGLIKTGNWDYHFKYSHRSTLTKKKQMFAGPLFS